MKKDILLIVLLGFAAFSNTLFNGFGGDDEIFIVDNSFYSSLKNIPSLFSADYFPGPRPAGEGHYYSGSVSYRPVLSATFFLDYWFWQLTPAGYHLTNVLLHILNAVLVYFLLLYLIKSRRAALFAALLFCVHPIQSEAVANIGYRADLVMTLFALLSLVFLFRYDAGKGGRTLSVLSVVCYALAMFAKESAVVLIGLVVLYDAYFRRIPLQKMIEDAGRRYGPFLAALAFYLFVYIFVFPNITLGRVGLMGGSLVTHTVTALWIFVLYLKSLMLPFSVHMLPPVYAPVVDRFLIGKFVLSLGCLAGLMGLAWKQRHKSEGVSFFICWLLITLIPVSNIFFNVNPMAFRFLYLPSIGFAACAAILLEMLGRGGPIKRLAFPSKIFVIGLCLAYVLPFNFLWKNNYSVANELIEHYPGHFKGYEILGFKFYNDQKYELAAGPLLKSIKLGDRDPRIYRMLEDIRNRTAHSNRLP